MPTEVTCRDTDTNESETRTIHNDWMVVADGIYEVVHVSTYANGTAVITVKKAKPE